MHETMAGNKDTQKINNCDPNTEQYGHFHTSKVAPDDAAELFK